MKATTDTTNNRSEEKKTFDGQGKSWEYFGLSYASWLVLPRIALQSMPNEWQKKFFTLVEEMYEHIQFPEGHDELKYVVTAKKGRRFTKHVLPHYKHNDLPYK